MKTIQLIVYGIVVAAPFLVAAGIMYSVMCWRDFMCQWDWAADASDEINRVIFPKE